MCGISGIIDQQPVTRNLVTSIGNLEYRGYDSCGMALLNGKGIEVRKNTFHNLFKLYHLRKNRFM